MRDQLYRVRAAVSTTAYTSASVWFLPSDVAARPDELVEVAARVNLGKPLQGVILGQPKVFVFAAVVKVGVNALCGRVPLQAVEASAIIEAAAVRCFFQSVCHEGHRLSHPPPPRSSVFSWGG